ncbi:MAG: FHA domain-containing protein [Clostridiales bacterium]|nr:FHA domain-containing protein [Clostridiales bacterium]
MSQRSAGNNWIIYTTADGATLAVDQAEKNQSAIWWLSGVARGDICQQLEADLQACAARMDLLVLVLKDVTDISSECLQMLVRLQKEVLDCTDGELRLVNAGGAVAEKLTRLRVHLALNVTEETLEQPKTDRPAVDTAGKKSVRHELFTDYAAVEQQETAAQQTTPEQEAPATPVESGLLVKSSESDGAATKWMLIDHRNGTIYRGGRSEVVIGRLQECDITLPMPSISRSHVKITFREDKWWVEDLNSKFGTKVDGQLLTANTPVALARRTASIQLSRFTFEWVSGACCALIDAQEAAQGPVGKLVHEASGESVCIVGKQMKIGRRYLPQGHQWNCSQVVSGEHAQICREQDGWYLVDLNSRNGTYLDDAKLTADVPAKLQDGARISLGMMGEKFRWMEGRGEEA